MSACFWFVVVLFWHTTSSICSLPRWFRTLWTWSSAPYWGEKQSFFSHESDQHWFKQLWNPFFIELSGLCFIVFNSIVVHFFLSRYISFVYTSHVKNLKLKWNSFLANICILTYIYFVPFLKMFSCCVQVKSEGPKLVPFFKATCVYFVLWLPTSSPSWFSALIKCLPIFCLWVFLLAHGINFLGAHSSARKILAGLIFSALGDAFLIWQEQGYFSHGEKFFLFDL